MKNNDSQRLVITSLTVLLVIGLSTSQAFAAPTGSGADLATINVARPQVVQLLDCSVDSGDVVAFETSRGQDADAHSTAVTDLETNGFVVREFNIDTQGIPDCIVKMVIPSTDADDSCIIGNDYSATQVTSIANWVNDGGALLLLNEWNQPGFANCGDLTEEISLALGETPDLQAANHIYTAGVNYDVSNPATLFSGVNSWEDFLGNTYAASSNAVVTDGVFPAGDPTTIAKEAGNGCVLMTGDGNWIRDPSINTADNQLLALNAFVYLNECIAPKVVGGEFLPIDATALLVAGAQTNAVWILSALAGIASVVFGALYLTTKRN